MTLAGNTVYPSGSIDTNFDPPQFPLDSTFKFGLKYIKFMEHEQAVSYTSSTVLEIETKEGSNIANQYYNIYRDGHRFITPHFYSACSSLNLIGIRMVEGSNTVLLVKFQTRECLKSILQA